MVSKQKNILVDYAKKLKFRTFVNDKTRLILGRKITIRMREWGTK